MPRQPYQLSNLLGQLRIAQQKRKSSLHFKFPSRFVIKNLEILENLGYIRGFALSRSLVGADVVASRAIVHLRYSQQGQPAISTIRVYSSPGRYWHASSYNLESILYRQKSKTFVFSTSYGLRAYTGFFSNTVFNRKLAGVLLYTIS